MGPPELVIGLNSDSILLTCAEVQSASTRKDMSGVLHWIRFVPSTGPRLVTFGPPEQLLVSFRWTVI